MQFQPDTPNSFSSIEFFKNHKAWSIATAGLAILVGYLGSRTVKKIGNNEESTKKIEELAQDALRSDISQSTSSTKIKNKFLKLSSDADDTASSIKEQARKFIEGTGTERIQKDFDLQLQLTSGEEEALTLAYNDCITNQNNPISSNTDLYTIYPKTGPQCVIELKTRPGVVFKLRLSEEDMFDEQLEIFRNAHQIVKEERLNHLVIPQCTLVEFTSKGKQFHFFAQEKLVTRSNYSFQKGLYATAFEDSSSTNFFKECLLQLTRFTCLTSFSDVKLDNIPLLLDGSGIGLYDLDTANAVSGLLRSTGSKIDGLLKLAPNLDILDELVSTAKNSLASKPDALRAFEKIWEESREVIRGKIEKRTNKRAEMRQFLKSSGIKGKEEFDLSKIRYDKKLKPVQKALLNLINQKIQDAHNVDLIQLRTIKFSEYELIDLWKNDEEIKKLNISFPQLFQTFTKAMEDLKKKKVLHYVKYNQETRNLSIRC